MTRATLGIRLAAYALPLFAPLALAAQEDDAFDRTPRDCIVSSNIDQTDAIDDQNIIFRMRGNRVYRNHLPRKCPGLERENRISYETRGARLCKVDLITVLEDSGGVGFGVAGTPFRQGFTCRLGDFVPLSPEEIEDLEFRENGGDSRGALESQPVELEEADDTAAREPEIQAPPQNATDEAADND